jgi:hypothetical protein
MGYERRPTALAKDAVQQGADYNMPNAGAQVTTPRSRRRQNLWGYKFLGGRVSEGSATSLSHHV